MAGILNWLIYSPNLKIKWRDEPSSRAGLLDESAALFFVGATSLVKLGTGWVAQFFFSGEPIALVKICFDPTG